MSILNSTQYFSTTESKEHKPKKETKRKYLHVKIRQ